MYHLESQSAKPIALLCETVNQRQPASSASPQYTPRLNFEKVSDRYGETDDAGKQ